MNPSFVPAAIRSTKTTRRTLLRGVAGLALLATVGGSLAGCSQAPTAAANIGTTTSEIAALAKTEGTVQLIAVPADWANYGGQFAAFKAKYGVDTPVATPDASSADEITAVKNLRGQKTQPDVIDIGYSFTKKAGDEKLIAPYKPSNFDAIPADLKDPNGMWVGAYYGVVTGGHQHLGGRGPEDLGRPAGPEVQGQGRPAGRPAQGRLLHRGGLRRGAGPRRFPGQHPARHRLLREACQVRQPGEHHLPGLRAEHRPGRGGP